jgi:hypothetical protein
MHVNLAERIAQHDKDRGHRLAAAFCTSANSEQWLMCQDCDWTVTFAELEVEDEEQEIDADSSR